MTILVMDTFDFFIEMMHFMLPAVIVFLVTYFTLKKMLDADIRKKELDMRMARSTELTPIKLQAYERFTILLERLSLDGLVMRLADPSITAAHFRLLLLKSIDDEFNHNLSQQIYISDQAWQMIKMSKEKNLQIIEKCFAATSDDSKATDLGKAILMELDQSKSNLSSSTIAFLKKEIDLVF